MIKVPLNKDVGSYEAKFVGPFTLRQSLCVLAAAPVCWGIYSGLTPILGGDIAGFLVLFPAALCWLIGWYKPYGMHTEKFIRSIFITTVLAPAHRKYKIRNRQTDISINQITWDYTERKRTEDTTQAGSFLTAWGAFWVPLHILL